MSELTPQDVLADLFAEEPFEIADANGAAQAAVQRLEDAGFRIFDAPDATSTVLSIAHRSADRRMWNAYAKAVLAVPERLVPAATELLRHLTDEEGDQ
jgi:hypothetical protein